MPGLARNSQFLEMMILSSGFRVQRHVGRRIAAFLLLAATLSVAQGPPAKSETERSSKSGADSHVSMGYEALKEDRYEAAIQEFQAALAIDPSLTLRARFPLAVALFENHRFDDARREFEAVRKVEGDHPNIFYYLGRLDIESRNFTAAIEELNRAAVKPPFPDTAYYLGYAYFKQGELAQASKWLEVASNLNPDDARTLYQLGLVYQKQGRAEESKTTIARSQSVRQRSNNESQIRLECGRKLDSGPLPEAIALCNQLYDDNDADKLTELGSIYGQHGHYQESLKPLQRAAELSPHSPQTQYNLALTYFRLNQFQEARAPLETVLQRWPDLFPLNSLYGAVLVKLGDYEGGLKALHHAHELDPKDASTSQLLYLTDLEMARRNEAAKDYKSAIAHLEEAAKLLPTEPAPHRNLAEVFTVTGDSQKAASEQQEANRLAEAIGTAAAKPD
jgi:tetratricopeptide (TPR) repeat protein